jgi:hypothetical protein
VQCGIWQPEVAGGLAQRKDRAGDSLIVSADARAVSSCVRCHRSVSVRPRLEDRTEANGRHPGLAGRSQKRSPQASKCLIRALYREFGFSETGEVRPLASDPTIMEFSMTQPLLGEK